MAGFFLPPKPGFVYLAGRNAGYTLTAFLEFTKSKCSGDGM